MVSATLLLPNLFLFISTPKHHATHANHYGATPGTTPARYHRCKSPQSQCLCLKRTIISFSAKHHGSTTSSITATTTTTATPFPSDQREPSRWQRRTAKRRQRTERLLDFLESRDDDFSRLRSDKLLLSPSSTPSATTWTTTTSSQKKMNEAVPILQIPPQYKIDWNAVPPDFDPMSGGNIQRVTLKGRERGERKRDQVEAFHFVLSTLLRLTRDENDNDDNDESESGVTIVDAGCGAGNLSIGLAGLLTSNCNKNDEHGSIDDRRRHRRYCLENKNDGNHRRNVHILAVDINPRALQSLQQRARQSRLTFDALTPTPTPSDNSTCTPTSGDTVAVTAVCADLARPREILSRIPPRQKVIVASLHACGAASDMAINLALECGAPFVVCPCCTAKSLTRRGAPGEENDYEASASFRRSGASSDIVYPRSEWLKAKLSSFRRAGDCREDDNGYDDDHNNNKCSNDNDNKRNSDNVKSDNTPNDKSNRRKGDNFHFPNILTADGDYYTLLAKVADVGLGPQTPTQQREQRRRAKRIVELDRLRFASERCGYDVRLVRMEGLSHDPMVYGKGDILLGARRGSPEADVLMQI
ncbi:hypothetical protein ACHAXS_005144 [Conticribra weissflogii]